MNHSFNVHLAELYGVEESIILSHLSYWVHLNKANDRNFHEGRYWTYNSAKAFAEIFPYWSAKKIWRLLDSLESDGLIVSGHFGEKAMDRTKWYSVREDIFDQCIFQKRKMEVPEVENVARIDSTSSSSVGLTDLNTDRNTEKVANAPKSEQTKDLFDNPETSSEPPASVTKRALEACAERIYSEYPKKAAKPAAIKAICKALKTTRYDSVLKATIAFAQEMRHTEMQYIPHPATWFNQERYKDDPETWRRKEQPSKGLPPGYIYKSGNQPTLPKYSTEF